jgi:hypothetical protein
MVREAAAVLSLARHFVSPKTLGGSLLPDFLLLRFSAALPARAMLFNLSLK